MSQNDILIVKDGATTGKVSFVNGDFPYVHAAINEHVSVWWLMLRRPILVSCSDIFSQPEVRARLCEISRSNGWWDWKTFVDKVFLPDIDLDEQRRVAKIIDKADGIRRKREQTLAMVGKLCNRISSRDSGIL